MALADVRLLAVLRVGDDAELEVGARRRLRLRLWLRVCVAVVEKQRQRPHRARGAQRCELHERLGHRFDWTAQRGVGEETQRAGEETHREKREARWETYRLRP